MCDLFVSVVLCIILCHFLFCNHLDEEERDGCFVTVIVLWLFFAVSWIGLQRVIVIIHDHTHLLFMNLFSFQDNNLKLQDVNVQFKL